MRFLIDAKASVLALLEGPGATSPPVGIPNEICPPTYDYTAVHCYGTFHLQQQDELDTALEDLTERMEHNLRNRWSTREIPRSEIVRRFAGIRLELARLESKFNLGQDESFRDALAAADMLATRHSHRVRLSQL